MIDEAAVAGDFAQERVLEEIRRHLMRSGHGRLGLRQRLAQKLDDARRLAGAAVEIALERRVEQDGGDVPGDDKPGQNGEHRDDPVAHAVH